MKAYYSKYERDANILQNVSAVLQTVDSFDGER